MKVSLTSRRELSIPVSSTPFPSQKVLNVSAIEPWRRVIPLFQGKRRITAESRVSGMTGARPKVSLSIHGN
jgi:hypothetical protein